MHKSTKNIATLTHFTTPEESPGYLLWHVSFAWRTSIEKILKPFNLTHPQFVVLASIAWLTRGGALVSQHDVGKASGFDPNTTSQIVRGLEAKNFVQRTRALNERSKNPALTPAGSAVLEQALPAVEKADAEFFEALTNKETAELVSMFQKIKGGGMHEQ